MKKALLAVVFAVLIPAMAIHAGGKKEKSKSNSSVSTPQRTTSSSTSTPASSPTPALPRYFTGDGGRGMSLAVLVPTGTGLTAEQNYLPTMVQGVLVGDLSKYSAISVLDRMKLETVLRETESGIYRDNAAYGRLGEIAEVDYALTGSITRTSTGYSMQIQIVGTGRNNIGVTRASYSGNCTIPEFDNYTGIRRASLELLTQLGVNLTDTARQELTAASSRQTVNSQTAVAQGIIAQRQGNTIESLARFYEANAYDSSFAEASARVNTLSATIRTGSLGQDLRNDIEWRKEWIKLYEDAAAWFRANPPVFGYIEVNTNLRQWGIDYKNETVHFDLYFRYVPLDIPSLKILEDLRNGLIATGRHHAWGIDEYQYVNWNQDCREEREMAPRFWHRMYGASFELVNDNGQVIARDNTPPINTSLGSIRTRRRGEIHTVSITNYRRYVSDRDRRDNYYSLHARFDGVKVKDITDNLTIRHTNIYELLNFASPNSSRQEVGKLQDWMFFTGEDRFYINRIGTDLVEVQYKSWDGR